MIQLIFAGVQFGIEPLPNGQGAQLNILDENSGIAAHIPFEQAGLKELVSKLSALLDDEGRRAVQGDVSGGIIIPSVQQSPPGGSNQGPQG